MIDFESKIETRYVLPLTFTVPDTVNLEDAEEGIHHAINVHNVETTHLYTRAGTCNFVQMEADNKEDLMIALNEVLEYFKTVGVEFYDDDE